MPLLAQKLQILRKETFSGFVALVQVQRRWLQIFEEAHGGH